MAIVKFENLSHIAVRNENHTEIVPAKWDGRKIFAERKKNNERK